MTMHEVVFYCKLAQGGQRSPQWTVVTWMEPFVMVLVKVLKHLHMPGAFDFFPKEHAILLI